MSYEVPEPIINGPYDEPKWHWFIEEGKPCEKREGRRPSVYYYRPPRGATAAEAGSEVGTPMPMELVNLIRERVKGWREAGYPGVTRTTEELLKLVATRWATVSVILCATRSGRDNHFPQRSAR